MDGDLNKSGDSARGSAADVEPNDGTDTDDTTNGTEVHERDGDNKSFALGELRFDVLLALIALVLGGDDTRSHCAMWRESIGECECDHRPYVLALESRRRLIFAASCTRCRDSLVFECIVRRWISGCGFAGLLNDNKSSVSCWPRNDDARE